MIYKNVRIGIFRSRPNRFVANVELDGEMCVVHVKNTGRCQELLFDGVRVAVATSDNVNRKTKYDLISVYREDYGWINIDSQVPNILVNDWLSGGSSPFTGITFMNPEFEYGQSRLDFYFEQDGVPSLMEVKGCTLAKYGIGYFPDAPTERGLRHIEELIGAASEGINAYITFVIQINSVDYCMPNREMQPEFADALVRAVGAGVKILFIRCDVGADRIEVRNHHIIEWL